MRYQINALLNTMLLMRLIKRDFVVLELVKEGNVMSTCCSDLCDKTY